MTASRWWREQASRLLLLILLAMLGLASCSGRGGRATFVGGGTTSEGAPPRVVGTVRGLRGLAEVQEEPGGEWRALRPGDTVGQGARVRTSKDGGVELVFEANGSTLALMGGTLVRLARVVLRDPATPTAIEVVIHVQQGQISGSLRSVGSPSMFEIVPPGGNSLAFRPAPGQTLTLGFTVPAPQLPPFMILTSDVIFSGGASYVALNGGQPYENGPAGPFGGPEMPGPPPIPEPATSGLAALAALGWAVWRWRRWAR